ncbi:MAG: phospholipase D-like domain-containing protein [Bacteroidota bacterium]
MTNQHTLFPQVQEYYSDLSEHLKRAQEKISMVFLAFDDGVWARKIAGILSDRAAAGVHVRLMVDGYGEFTDNLRHVFQNRKLLARLEAAGVRVHVFQPHARGLGPLNRMHCKITAIDGGTAYLGGSNLGDYYTSWNDTNLRVDGQLAETFHELFDHLCHFSETAQPALEFDASDLQAGSDRIRLTIPRRTHDIRNALLHLIRGAEKAIYIRTWYFLPDPEMLDLLCEQAQRGIRVHILLSDDTRLRPVDLANHVYVHRLVKAGAQVYRYRASYMHAKVAWNDRGDVLLGSANLDPHSMHGNFESCLQFRDGALCADLLRAFEADLPLSIHQAEESYTRRSLPKKALIHACTMTASWL